MQAKKPPTIGTLDNRILSLIRNPQGIAKKYLLNENDVLLISVGGVRKRALYEQLASEGYTKKKVRECLDKLAARNKFGETRKYIVANPSDRIRPIASNYNVERPRVARTGRYKTHLTITGRDKHLLWEADARKELSESGGESAGVFVVLEFLRSPRVWRLWQIYRKNKKLQLTEMSK